MRGTLGRQGTGTAFHAGTGTAFHAGWAGPIVRATNQNTSANSTSHSVSLPAGVQAGELLVIFVSFDNQGDVIVNTPAGWTSLFTVFNVRRMVGFYRVSDGGEGASVDVTTSATRISAQCSYRIAGALTAEAATSASEDPPNLSPSWGSAKTLWLVSANGSGTLTETPPTNYTNSIGAAVSAVGLRSARRELEAISENPGAWTGANTTATVAIRPS